MDDLSRELDSRTTDFTKVANLLGNISKLESMENFSNIGKEAGKWETYTRECEEETAFYSLVLSREEQSELSEDIGNWLFEYKKELGEMIAITPEADLPADKLSEGPEAFLTIQLEGRYESEHKDMEEACRNLLCGTYTSAEMMSLRTIESLLRKWYKSEKGEDPEDMDWHDVFGALKASEDVDEFQGMDYLDLLRERRNKVAHPDVHSVRREAELTLQRTFDIIEKVINIIETEENS
jgi:hypothetical protein